MGRNEAPLIQLTYTRRRWALSLGLLTALAAGCSGDDDPRGPMFLSCDARDVPPLYICSESGWGLDDGATWDEQMVRDFCECADGPSGCVPGIYSRAPCPRDEVVGRCLFGSPRQASYHYAMAGVDYTDPSIRDAFERACSVRPGVWEFLDGL